MNPRSNPRWMRFAFCLLVLVSTMALVPSAFAGNTHSEGGAVIESPGVPETDGTATVQIYWTGDTSARSSVTVGSALAGYWLADPGFDLARQWLVGDEHVAWLEFQTGAGTAAHAGYYGVATKILTSLDPDEFPTMSVAPIPVPVANAGGGFIDVSWNRAASIAGYNLYRSTDGISFAKLNATLLADSTYHDTGVAFGTTYRYALGFVYRGTPALPGSALSANSAPATPLDSTPPNVPVLASEPGFTSGTQNTIAWSSQAASGATAYWADCALDAAFTSLVGNSGWIADSTFTFTGLADGRSFFYRVRARDEAQNASDFSNATSSRQDASAPASHVLALADYKVSSTVSLEWIAADSLSGVSGVQLYYSKDGGAFAPYAGGPFTSSPIAFDAATTGGDGTYAFYTLASDAVANAETAPEAPDATTIIDTQAPAQPVIASLPAFTAGTARTLAWDRPAGAAVAYQIEASQSDTFDPIAGASGWMADTTFTFTGLTDGGLYRYRARARDQAGNISTYSDVAASAQDASAPSTAVTALPEAMTTSSLAIAWTGGDATSGMAGIELYWSKDGGALAPYAGGPFHSSPIAFDATTTGGDGTYAFYTRATDAVGNQEAAPATADAQTRIDTQVPAQPLLASLPAYTTGTSRATSWEATDADQYLVQASTDAEFSSIAFESGWIAATSFEFSGLADGQQYFYRMQGRDLAGNQTAFSALVSSTQDATAPASQIAALPAYSTTSMLSLSFTASDATSGLAGIDLYYAKDGGPMTLCPGSPFASSPIAFDAATTGGDGHYAFHTRAHDAAGNLEAAPASPDAEIGIDTSIPAQPVLASLPAYSMGNARTLSWSASTADQYLAQASTDAAFASIAFESGWIAGTSYEFTGLADRQQYFYRLRGRDLAGNETPYSSQASSIQDATAPTSQLAALPAYSTTSALSLAFTASDATSGLAGIDLYYSKDGGPTTLYPGSPFASSPIAFDAATAGGDGQYSLYTRAHDAAGNEEAAPAGFDAETRIDTQPPSKPMLAALPSYSAGTSRLLSWNDSGAHEYLAQAATDAAFSSIAFESGWIAATSFEFTTLTDGQQYFYRVRGRDEAGNLAPLSEVASSTQDATLPVTAAAALPALSSSAALSIAWTGSDATSGMAGVDLLYSKDGGAYDAYPGGPFASSPIAFDAATTGGDGAYRFYTRGHDAAGNIEPAPASPDAQTTIDTAAPGAPNIAGLQSFVPGTSLHLAWSDESTSGAIEYMAEMSTAASFATIAASSGWTAANAFDFTSLTDGQRYFFRVKARDNAHNETGWSGMQSATMDASAPIAALESLPQYATSAQLQLAWTGSDATSGIENVDLYYSKNGGPMTLHAGSPFASSPIAFDAATTGGDGHYAFYIRARDGVGNLENAPPAPDAEITIDTAAPSIPTLAALPAFTPGTSRTLSWTDASASGATAYLAQMASDAAFTDIRAESGWIAATSYEFTGLIDAQRYHYRLKSRDAAGNESAFAAALQSMQDASAPTSQLTALPAFSTSANLTLAWSGSDATSGLAGIQLWYSKDGAPFAQYPGGPFTSSPIAFDAGLTGGDGSYNLYTRAADAVGNIEDAPASADARTTIDTSAPSVPAIASMPQFLPGTSMTLHWSDLAASGATAYRAQMSSQASFSSLDRDTGWITATSFIFSSLQDGSTYWYRVQARDAAQNETGFSAAVSATQDATAPSSQLASLPALGNQATLALEWTGFDITSGLDGVDLYYSRNGGSFLRHPDSPFDASPMLFRSADLGGDGQYAFYIRAHDAAGNIEPPPSAPDAQTRIDTTPPAVPALASLGRFSPGSSLGMSWSNTSASGAIEYAIEMSTSPSFATLAGQSGWISTTSYTFNSLDDGTTYWFRVKSRDAAQNESAYAAAQSTTLDDTPPASVVSALPAVTPTLSFPIAWTGSDATSGIASVDLYYARDGGAYTLYPGGPFGSSPIAFEAALTGGQGQYAYYTRARDAVGNREASPGGPDAQTLVNTSAAGAPTLAAMPPFTAGTSRAIGWTPGGNNSAWMAQASEDAGFAAIAATSGWISSTTYTFNGLSDGHLYWYRVKARNSLGVEGPFSSTGSSTQDASAPQSQASALPATQASQQFAIAWTGSDATSGIAGVDLYVSRNGGAYAAYAGGPFTASPIAFDASTLGGDGQYAFYTRATDAVGNVEAAPAAPDAQTTVSTGSIGAPTLASMPAYAAGTSLSIAWTPGGNNAAWLVQSADDALFASIHAASGWITSTTYTFNGLSDAHAYYYRVKARNSIGIEGPWSAIGASTQDASAPQSQASALPATQSSQQFAIAWTGSDATSGIAGVDLYVSRNGGAYAAYAGGPFAASPIAFDASTLGGDGQYAFYTRATDAVGNTEAAAAQADASTIIDSQAPPAPAMADEPESTPGSSNTVSWSSVAGASEYFAQCATDAQFAGVLATSGWTAQTSYTFTGLAPGSTYFYRVRARDAAGNTSPWSAPVLSTQSAGQMLMNGWNLISFNVTPPSSRIDLVLASLQGSYSIVRTYAGGVWHTYLPSLPVEMNDLSSMDARQGYWIYMTRPDTMLVTGTPVAVNTPIDLGTGWNLASYLPNQPMSPGMALVSIAGNYLLARGYEPGAGYRTYYPAMPGLSDLSDMRTGRAYWLYMTAPDQLVYSALALAATDLEAPARHGKKMPVLSKNDGAAVPTVMDVWSTTFSIDGEPAPAGTVLEAYDASGTLCGRTIVKQPGVAGILHLNGDVSITDADEGAMAGDAIILKVQGRDLTLLDTQLSWQAEEVRQMKLEFVSTESLLPKAFALGQNSPNPFNPATVIAYEIPARVEGAPLASTRVRLSIYDVRGHMVRTLVSAQQAPGRYRILWNGRDDHDRPVSGGVYFYRLQTDQYGKSRKMVLVK